MRYSDFRAESGFQRSYLSTTYVSRFGIVGYKLTNINIKYAYLLEEDLPYISFRLYPVPRYQGVDALGKKSIDHVCVPEDTKTFQARMQHGSVPLDRQLHMVDTRGIIPE